VLNRLFRRRFADTVRRVELCLQYTGSALLWKRRNIRSEWSGLRWLNPNLWLLDLSSGGLDGFRLYYGGWGYQNIDTPDRYVHPEDAVYMHEFSFNSDFEGVGWVERAFNAAASEEEMSLTVLAFMRNRAVPLLLVMPAAEGGNAGDTDEKLRDFKNFKAALRDSVQGSANAGKTLITPDRWDVHEVTVRFDQAAMPELYKQIQENISVASHVPLSLVMSDKASYADGYGQEQRWLSGWLIPRAEWYAEWLTEAVQNEFGLKWRVVANTEEVGKRVASLKTERILAQVQGGTRDIYSAQVEMGIEPDERLKGVYIVGGVPTRVEDFAAGRYPAAGIAGVGAGALPAISSGGAAADSAGSLPPRPGKSAGDQVGFGFLVPLAENDQVAALRAQARAIWQGDDVRWLDPAEWHLSLAYAMEPPRTGVINPLLLDERLDGRSECFAMAWRFEIWDTADGPCLVARVRLDAPLADIQKDCYAMLAEQDVAISEFSAPDAYTPHITLGYGGPLDAELPDPVTPAALLVDAVALVAGEETLRAWSLPAGGGEHPRGREYTYFPGNNGYGEIDAAAMHRALNEIDAWARHDGKSAAFEPGRVPADTAAVVRHWLSVLPASRRTEAFGEGKAHYMSYHAGTAAKAYADTEATYRAVLTDLISSAFEHREGEPVISRKQFGEMGRAEIRAHFTQVFIDGLREAGVVLDSAGELDEDEQAQIKVLRDDEAKRWTKLANELYQDVLPQRDVVFAMYERADLARQRGDEAAAQHFMQLAETNFANFQKLQRKFIDRVGLWVNKGLARVFQMGKLAADANQMMEWVLGKTEEHCRTCLAAAGQRHRARDWQRAGIIPKTDRLICGGFYCDCQLVPVPGERARGRLDKIPLAG
jgi:hypothetical protein